MPTVADVPQARFWHWLGWIYCAVVLALAMWPNPVDTGGHGIDKLLHASAFACLGGWFAALAPSRQRLLAAAFGLALFGGLIEILQGLSGYRDAEWLDWVADLVGIGLGLWLLRSVTSFSLRYIEARVQAATHRR